ncbi:MAG: formyltransferase family protein [Bacteroidota bacterium]
MRQNKIGIFADKEVGRKALSFLLEKHSEDVALIVCTNNESKVFSEIIQPTNLCDKTFFYDDLKTPGVVDYIKSLELEYIILAWWPYILKEPILSIPLKGVINFHPSFLPYNRGKHYNFWNLIEEVPFGVTLHFVDNTIDGGDIIFQKRIDTTWEDTGETLYFKAQEAMTKLFEEAYPEIKAGNYTRIKQNLNEGSFHFGKELEGASCIKLDEKYTARELLNILRARTFAPHPGSRFEDSDGKYEVRISIEKISS